MDGWHIVISQHAHKWKISRSPKPKATHHGDEQVSDEGRSRGFFPPKRPQPQALYPSEDKSQNVKPLWTHPTLIRVLSLHDRCNLPGGGKYKFTREY